MRVVCSGGGGASSCGVDVDAIRGVDAVVELEDDVGAGLRAPWWR